MGPHYVHREGVPHREEPAHFISVFYDKNDGVEEEMEFPGPSLLFKYSTFSNFDIYLQFILFFTFLVFIMVFILFLHRWKVIKFISEIIPESAILLIVGSFIGLLGNYITPQVITSLPSLHSFQVSHLTFYSILIPPIILHASYDLHHPEFFQQIPSVLLMATVGTALNAALISIGLYLLYAVNFNPSINIYHILTFSSIIAAVDPVAVLAVFDSVNADAGLYYLVFGEALLNDGVTFVLFEGFKELALVPSGTHIPWGSFVFVVLSFISAPLGGFICGAIGALLSAFITKYTNEVIKHLETIIILSLAMLSYVISTKSGWSGIIAIITCGLLQVRYALPNLHPDSRTTVVNIVKTIAVTCEILIFVLLGNSFTKGEGWDWRFICFTIFFTYLFRFIVVFLLSNFLNCFRKKKINWKWQVIVFLGGLRGAIAYTMAISYNGPFNQMFADTTLVIIFVTVIINGIATKPLVKYFKLDKDQTGDNKPAEIGNHSQNSSEPKPGTFRHLEQNYIFPILRKKEEEKKNENEMAKVSSKPIFTWIGAQEMMKDNKK